MTLEQKDIDCFDHGRAENARYWERFGGKPDFKDAVVVDLGCGHGSLCIDIAQSGAGRVLGLDLNARLIDFANENLKQNYPQFVDVVEFRYQQLQEVPESDIDFFVSKDTFEHVVGLEPGPGRDGEAPQTGWSCLYWLWTAVEKPFRGSQADEAAAAVGAYSRFGAFFGQPAQSPPESEGFLCP